MDDTWADIAEVLAQVKRKDGRPPEQSDRMFVEAVLYLARTGVPWRDLPKAFGRWDAVDNRFRRWEKSGVWRQLWEGLQPERFKTAKQVFIDSTIVRAHQHAAGALKKTAVKKPRRWAVLVGASPRRFTSDALMSIPAWRS
jgi:putative transposase